MISEIPAQFLLDAGTLHFWRVDDDDAPEFASECVLAPSIVIAWAAEPEPDNGSGWTFDASIDGVGFTHCRTKAFRLLEGADFRAARDFLDQHHSDAIQAAAEGLARAMFGKDD